MSAACCLCLLLLCVGCMVGPNYCRPKTVLPENFTESQSRDTVLIADEDLFHWWQDLFQDPFLDQLMEEALEYNFDLAIALQTIYQARATYWIDFTAILPQIESDFQASRFRISESFASALSPTGTTGAISDIQNFYQTGLDAIWQIDLFGGLRRAARSAYDTWEATIEERRGVKITVLSEVASIYVTICYYQTKVALASQLVELDRLLVDLLRDRFQSGLVPEEELIQSLSVLEADEATLFSLESALKQNIYSLAVLLGRLPEDLVCDFAVNRPIPIPKLQVPEMYPADLLRRRPDIATAERQLAAQTEQIGVAIAELFPTVNLIGSSSTFASNPLQGANIGFSSDRFNKLFKSQSLIWGIGTLITWPVFDWGKRCANVGIQRSLTKQAYLNFQKVVITALQEVEISYVTYFNEQRRLQAFEKQTELLNRNTDLIADQFQSGLADYTQVIQAKEQWLAAVNSFTDSQRALDLDLIAIYNSLGGDW